MKGMQALSVLDIAQLENVTMNDIALMREVVGALLSDASRQIESLQQALERADTRECKRLAHGLVGACGNVGAVSLAAVSSSLERYAHAGDMEQCRSSVERLSVEVERLRDAATSL
jgi:HPt (histidine-containing phosphotransfer) domain-containing protein